MRYNLRKYLSEAKDDYQVYHDTLTSAVQEMEKWATKKKFELDKEELAEKIGLGPAKPKDGKTNKYNLTLYKNGKAQKKMLQMQVYGMGNKYELNMYIL